MSDNIAIKVENLSKVYKLYNSPLDRLKESLHPFRKQYHADFYALNDVSFEIQKGESVGIIGKNGSGKSTLLKIVTGVLTPSSGFVQVNGKISALLELGAGFNPELSGIENVYFNGTLMGYTHEEMNERLDRILSFADIGDFVMQPVKTYSSGMFVRLAFAVAVNVEPEILIVDEALSVGDALFQQRCIARIRAMRNAGVTLLFVSHTPDVLRALCTNGIWLEHGQIKMRREAVKVSNAYQNEIYLENNRLAVDLTSQPDSLLGSERASTHVLQKATKDITNQDDISIHYVLLKNSQGEVVDQLNQGEEFVVEIAISSKATINNLSVGILIKDKLGIDLTGESIFNKLKSGITLIQDHITRIMFRSKLLLSGGQDYAIAISLNSVSKWDRSDNVLLYRDDTALVFKVNSDLEEPMWFKFYQDFEVTVNAS